MRRLFIFAMVLGALGSGSWAKEPITDGETDPVMLDLDPYLIDALRG